MTYRSQLQIANFLERFSRVQNIETNFPKSEVPGAISGVEHNGRLLRAQRTDPGKFRQHESLQTCSGQILSTNNLQPGAIH